MHVNVLRTAGFLFVFSIFLSSAIAEMRPVLKKRAGTPPYEVLEEIIRTSNTRSAEIAVMGGSSKLTQITPDLIWVIDPNPELQPSTVYREPENKVMILRSHGSSIEAVQDQLDHAVLKLLSPVLLFSSSTGAANVGNRADVLHDLETNIDRQIDLAVKRYNQRVENGRLTVIGSIHDSGNLYRRGSDHQIIINVNGEKDGDTIRNLPFTARMTPDDLTTNFGRD